MEQIENKYEFFYKPTTKQEIVGEREIVPATKYNLADRVNDLSDRQAIVLDYTIDRPDQILIPERYAGSENFLKHGRKIVADSSRPMWKSREEKFQQVYGSKQKDKEYFAEFAGLTWKPFGTGVDERSRIVHLVDSLEAVRIYNYISNSGNAEDLAKIVHEAKPSRKGVYEGANYGVNLVSRSGCKREYVGVTLKHVPFTRKGEPAKVMSGLEGTCDCEYSRFHNLVYQDNSTGRKSPLFIDMHAIAAYLFLIDKEQNSLDRFMEPAYEQQRAQGKNVDRKVCVAMVYNPFPLPTQKTLNDYIKLEKQVMVKDFMRDKEGKIILGKMGAPRTQHRPLNRAEKELFLFNYVAANGPGTFFATKRLRDYKIEG